jgi:hypothetical protein
MCDVCVAWAVLEAKAPFMLDWGEGVPYKLEVEARGEGAEFQPAEIRFRRPEEDWSEWVQTHDLASRLSILGADTPWKYQNEDVRAYIEGREDSSKVLARLKADTRAS